MSDHCVVIVSTFHALKNVCSIREAYAKPNFIRSSFISTICMARSNIYITPQFSPSAKNGLTTTPTTYTCNAS